MPKLVDQRTGGELELARPVTLIGRAEYCDLCIPERTVSREHARIRRRLTGHYIEDLGSTHGTRVNGVRIRARVRLSDGDVITIGPARPEGQGTVTLHLPHVDTTVVERGAAPPPQDAPPPAEPVAGAAFVFRQ